MMRHVMKAHEFALNLGFWLHWSPPILWWRMLHERFLTCAQNQLQPGHSTPGFVCGMQQAHVWVDRTLNSGLADMAPLGVAVAIDASLDAFPAVPGVLPRAAGADVSHSHAGAWEVL